MKTDDEQGDEEELEEKIVVQVEEALVLPLGLAQLE